jgi:hypothetical protein
MTLLEEALNRRVGSSGYSAKRAAYAESRYRITRQIAAEEWTSDVIAARQAEMADAATQVWRTKYED